MKNAIQRLEIAEDKPMAKNSCRLIVSFSGKRMKKDCTRQEKRRDRLEKNKGYLTNTGMAPRKVIAAYRNLWHIETGLPD